MEFKVKRSELLEEARSYLRTEWRHGCQLKGVGVDCVRFPIAVYNHFGLGLPEHLDYSKQDEFIRLVLFLRDSFDKVQPPFETGDLLLFRYRGMPNHLGLYTENGNFIHARSDPSCKMVVEQELTGYWKLRLHSIYRTEGIV